MLAAPNFLRPGVVGGFVLTPPQQTLGVQFTANTTWVTGGFPSPPSLGSELIFEIGDAYSGMPLVVGSCFNWRGPWRTGTSYAVGDVVAWLDLFGQVQTYYCITAWGGGSSFDYTKWQLPNFRGAWVASTAYAPFDLVNALDVNGDMQTWVATAGLTSGATFLVAGVPAPQWTGALATNQIFFVVGTEAGGIQIATSTLGAPITLMTSGLFCSPDVASAVEMTIATGAYGAGSGLAPGISIGALFAQGTLYQPVSAPTVPAAPANQFSYLAYNSTTGLYWTTNPAGTTAGDAVLGWVTTDATDILAASDQNILIGGVATTAVGTIGVGGSGPGVTALRGPGPVVGTVTIGFGINTGVAAVNAAPYAIASHGGTVSQCVVVVKQADPAVGLAFTIYRNGVSVFASSPTVAAGAMPGVLLAFAGLSSTLVNQGDIFEIQITAGTARWQFTAQLET